MPIPECLRPTERILMFYTSFSEFILDCQPAVITGAGEFPNKGFSILVKKKLCSSTQIIIACTASPVSEIPNSPSDDFSSLPYMFFPKQKSITE